MLKVIEGGFAPVRSTKYSAYVDLFSREDVTIGAGETKIVPLGVKINLDKLKTDWINKSELIFKPDSARKSLIEFGFHKFMSSHYLEVALRSSLALKGLIISNGIGIIDLDYSDEIGLIVHNPIKKPIVTFDANNIKSTFKMNFGEDFNIKKGHKVAQCTLKEHKGYLMGYESDTLREGGFGSTGERNVEGVR